MSQILVSLTSVFNLSATKYINTGDRNLDNALIVLSSVIIASIMNYIFGCNYKQMYNKFVYYAFYLLKDVSDPKSLPYLHPAKSTFETSNTAEITKNNNNPLKTLAIQITYGKKFIDFLNFQKYLSIYKQGLYSSMGDYIAMNVYNGNVVYGQTYFNSSYDRLTFYSDDDTAIIYTHEKIMKQYEEYVKSVDEKNKTQKIYCMKSEGIVELGNISKNKVFDTLFYDQKEELINLLTKFKNGKLYPKCISMDNKLGILLYGPPGTGKTGTISAIANMLERDVLQINFSEITTCGQLDAVLSEKNRSKILVFDEFDCIMDALINPNKIMKEPDNTSNKWADLLAVAEGDERKEILKMVKENKSPTKDTILDLGYLLYKLDGLEDNNNRIIIATTNNPEKINPTLLRPGRFDIKLCLQNCSGKMLKDIIGNFFDNHDFNVDKIPVKKYSPLEVINACLVHNNLEKVLSILV